MSRCRICTPGQLRRNHSDFGDSTPWVYLGKDLSKRASAGRVLGEFNRLHLGNRLHTVAERLRQPFLDFIGNLGRVQRDRLGWWASSCSWKNSSRSDLFLLACYLGVADELLYDLEGLDRRLVIVLEDPWLFSQLRDMYAERPGVQFHGSPVLWLKCLRAFVFGIGSRVVWSGRLLRQYVAQRWLWKWETCQLSNRPQIGLYSYPQDRCLNGTDGWTDPYLGNLDSILEKAGHSIVRFSPPEVGGYESALAKRSHYFAPLILWSTIPSFLRSLRASWRPVWPSITKIGGLPVRRLLLREWWLDRWRSSHFLFHLFFESFTTFLACSQIRLLIYPYENQPWERLLVLAARAQHVPTLGYQHGGGLAPFMLPYFYGEGEADWAPVPDMIVTSGVYSFELLAAGGVPRSRLTVGGSFRHEYLWSAREFPSVPLPSGRVQILVAMPIDHDLTQHLLHSLRKAFPDGGASDGLEFIVKPHPMSAFEKQDLQWPAKVAVDSFDGALRCCAVVLYSGSGTGIEAWVMGRTVLRYRSELLLDADRMKFLDGNAVIDCGDEDLRKKLLAVRDAKQSCRLSKELHDVLTHVVPPPDSDIWLQAVARFASPQLIRS